MKKPQIKGSMLVVTMMIMGIILFVSLSISLTAVRQRKASMGAGSSNQAFQTADSGVEILLQKIKDVSASNLTVDQLADAENTCEADGSIKGNMGYQVELKDKDGNPIDCNSNTIDASEIASIKSIGTKGDNQRAIEAAVADPLNMGITGGCVIREINFIPGGPSFDVVPSSRPLTDTKIEPRNRWGSGCVDEYVIKARPDRTNDGMSLCEAISAPGFVCGYSGSYNIGDITNLFNTCLCISKTP